MPLASIALATCQPAQSLTHRWYHLPIITLFNTKQWALQLKTPIWHIIGITTLFTPTTVRLPVTTPTWTYNTQCVISPTFPQSYQGPLWRCWHTRWTLPWRGGGRRGEGGCCGGKAGEGAGSGFPGGTPASSPSALISRSLTGTSYRPIWRNNQMPHNEGRNNKKKLMYTYINLEW